MLEIASGNLKWRSLTVSNTNRSPSDVVTVEGLIEFLAEGWRLHVVCRQDAELRGYQWHGSWYLVGVSPDLSKWVVLVTRRDLKKERARAKAAGRDSIRGPEDYTYREIKTASGVISALREIGISATAVPTRCGESIMLPAVSTSTS